MTIFEQLNDILDTKSGTMLDDLNVYQEFQPYIVSRWLSMHSPVNAVILNETVNQLYSGISTKDQWYQLFTTLVPKSRNKYTRYIKKPKKVKSKSTDASVIDALAQSHQLSKREVKSYIEQFNIDITQIKGIK